MKLFQQQPAHHYQYHQNQSVRCSILHPVLYLLKKFSLLDSIIKRDLSYRQKKSWSISQQFLTVTSFFHVSSHDVSIWTYNHNVFRKIYLSESQLDWWQSQHFVIIIYIAHPSNQQKINIFCNLSLFCLTSQRRQP